MRILRILEFLLFYVKEIVLSNVRIAHDVLTPRHRMKPGIIAVEVGDLSERQLAAMANLITMTPGTLGMYVSKDRKLLYIHSMYMDKDAEAIGADLARDYGRRVKHVFR
ncbi:MAG: sodium:proton antiporter [Verrucomicrobia bacterium]|nr:sodium:proton antiporter [Verrucomicrobiota bacterium]